MVVRQWHRPTVGDMHLDGEDSVILIVDFRMLDFSLEVKATAGDMHLGGEDFDYLVVDRCMHDFILEATATAGDVHPGGEFRLPDR